MSGTADLEAHAEALALLGEDCADMPAPLLDEAARRWAREQKWMPKASELRELARAVQGEKRVATGYTDERLQAHCDLLNEITKGRDGWHVIGAPGSRTIAKRNERTEPRA